MKYVSTIILLLSTSAMAQDQLLSPYLRFTKPEVFQKLLTVKSGVKSNLPALYSPLDPALYSPDFNQEAFDAMIESSQEEELTINSKILFDSSIISADTATIGPFPGEPKICPAKYGGAIFTGTYYRTGDGINISFPTTLPAGLFPSTCVNQPNGNRTCYVSVVVPGHQVCDYGASPYNQFVTNHECDLLNQLPGVSFYAPGDRYEHRQISSFCQKFEDGSLERGALPVLLSIKKRASANLDNVVKIENGDLFSCALRDVSGVGELYCWGKNINGELGMGTVGFASTHAHKVVFPGITSPNVIDFSVSRANVCAVLKADALNPSGSLFCWGDNDVGQIGASAGLKNGIPQKIVLKYARSLDYGPDSYGRTGYAYPRTLLNLESGEVIKQISIGNVFISGGLSGFTGCFVTNWKKSYCWGNNVYGQYATTTSHSGAYGVVIRQAFTLEPGSTASSSIAPEIPRSAGTTYWAAKSIHVAGHAICILGADLSGDTRLQGKVLCAGTQQGTPGILGNSRITSASGTYTTSGTRTTSGTHTTSLPVIVETAPGVDLKNVMEISANEKLICARVDNSTFYSAPSFWKANCWGKVPGASGLVTKQVAEPLKWNMSGTMVDVDGVRSVAVGEYNVCVVRNDLASLWGSNLRSYCMGINRSEMFGDNALFGRRVALTGSSDSVLTEFDFLHKYLDASGAGTFDNCGLATATSTSTRCTNRETIGVSMIANGKGQPSVAHHCHIRAGNVFCTGENYVGQLGNADLRLVGSAPVRYPDIAVQF
jgi:hypothetical protein